MSSPSDKDYGEGKYSTYKFNEFDSFLRSSLGLYAQETLQSSEIPLVLRALSRGNIEEVAILPASKVLKEPPEDLYFLYGPINKQIVRDGLIEPRQEDNQNNHHSGKIYHEERRRDYDDRREDIARDRIIPRETRGRKRNLEGRIAVTNVTKGKMELIAGKVSMGLSFLPPAIALGNYAYQYSQGNNANSGNIKSWAIVGGILFGIGLITYTIGKIKNWYWNKNYYENP